MSARIIERGRGPEIEGTRITVYTIMDYERAHWPTDKIAELLRLSEEQVRVALAYIREHREQLEPVYQEILQRVNRGNPEWVKKLLAEGEAEFRQRLEACKRDGAHNGDAGQ